ncbi:MAG: hypothetical protein LRY54_03580 [Alphaproteobacteria bacterium]|nr:hypothetical protein [Alphaproteobacteria bacterium]
MKLRIFTAILILLAGAVMVEGESRAQTQSSTEVAPTCDVTVQDQMKRQAWMEGQREMEMAQRLILKPDSVLEYSCFKDEANHWSSAAGTFSNNGGGSPSGNLSNAINSLVLSSLSEYLKNYGHLFLGGTFEEEGGKFLQQLGQTGSQCNPQYWVWYLAKCVNSPVTSEGRPSHFFALSTLVDKDIRNMPQSCPATEKNARDDLLKTVQEKQDDFPDPTKNPPLGVDNASHITGTASGDLYSKLLTTCGQPVKTGFKVKPLSGSTQVIDDAVCIAPGCSYINGSCQ